MDILKKLCYPYAKSFGDDQNGRAYKEGHYRGASGIF